MRTQDIEYSADGARLVGWLAVDPDRPGRRPGVLVAPEGGGLSDLTRRVARRLADLGYVAFAMDYYGGGAPLADREQMMAQIGAFSADPSRIRARAAAALQVLAAQPEADPGRLAAIGYCFGGTTALELARGGADVKAVVGFHSGLGTVRPQDARNIRGKVLVCIGVQDPIVPPEQRAAFEREMTQADVDWRMTLFGQAAHSFTNPDADATIMPGLAYHALSDERSWRAMIDLFDETFGPMAA
jgi:dienelactone hydrolase